MTQDLVRERKAMLAGMVPALKEGVFFFVLRKMQSLQQPFCNAVWRLSERTRALRWFLRSTTRASMDLVYPCRCAGLSLMYFRHSTASV